MADGLEDIRTRVTLQEHGLINVSFISQAKISACIRSSLDCYL
jgi:hypothetical protein